MKYLNKRSDFLNKRINLDYSLLNENMAGAGPFANDVGWNDSLLGRLINHVIRKAKIKANMLRMKPLIERLKQEFDRMVDESVLIDNPDVVKESFKLTLFTIFKELKDAIDNGKEVSYIKSLTITAIDTITKLDTFDKKDIILSELNKFKDFLDTLVEEEPKEEEETKESENPPYVLTIENLKALSSLLGSVVRPEKTGSNPNNKTEEVTNEELTTTRRNTFANKANNAAITASSKWNGLKQSATQSSATQSVTATQSSNLETTNNDVFNKLNSALLALESTRNSKHSVGVTKELIDSLIASKDVNLTRNLYRTILKSLNKSNINENIDLIKDKNRMLIVADKIATFIRVVLSLEGKSTGKDNDTALKTFIITIKKIIASYKVPVIEKEPKVEPKKESLILRYINFIKENAEEESTEKNTKENAEDTDTDNTDNKDIDNKTEDTSEDTTSNKIKTFFEQECKEVNSFNMTEEEYKVLSEKVKKVEGVNKNLTFDMDPVLEIMGLFIRAYKIYTVQTITKRSENVDTNTLSEYTSFGSGDAASGRQGPYRNNKLFEMWEDAVRDIMKNRKYQALFTRNASLRLPKVVKPSFSKPEDWELKPEAGIQFRKFMNEILDGDKLYKSGSDKGKVSAFVNQYFGDTATDPNKINVAPDSKAVGEMQSAIDKNSTKLKLESVDVSSNDFKQYTLFSTRLTDKNGDKTQRAFFITDVDANYVYVSYALIKGYNNYFDKLGTGKKVIEVGSFPVPLTVGTSPTHYSKIKKTDLNNLFKTDVKLNFKNVDNQGIVSNDEYTVTSDIYWLVKEDKTLFRVEDGSKMLEVIKNSGDKVTKNLVDPNTCIITKVKTT